MIAATLSRIFTASTAFLIINTSVPTGAVNVYGAPFAELVSTKVQSVAESNRDIQKRRDASASRPLTDKECKNMMGKDGLIPYFAGQNKWETIIDGINVETGNYSMSSTDLTFEGGYGIPVNVTRSYSSNNIDEGPFGRGWSLSADVRSTAGGILKSSATPIRGVPLEIKERPSAQQDDPNAMTANGALTSPVQAVITSDASGKDETVQRDVDGILSNPPFDSNVHDKTEYQEASKSNGDPWLDPSGRTYKLVVSNETSTPDGTIYHYSKHGTYGDAGTRPWSNPSATGEPSNVLKLDWAKDRNGNVTSYTYDSASATFVKANGTITEHKLIGVQMPNGRSLTFHWTGNRIDSVTDGTRTVSYTYSGGQLTSMTSPGLKTTAYGYTAVSTSGPLLSSIADSRGLTTSIDYFFGQTTGLYKDGSGESLGVIRAFNVDKPDGTFTYINTFGANPMVHKPLPPSFGTGAAQEDWACVMRGTVLPNRRADDVMFINAEESPNQMYVDVTASELGPGSVLRAVTYKDFSKVRQDLLSQTSYRYPIVMDSGLSISRKLASTNAPTSSKEETSYNFLGSPLQKRLTEWTGTNTTPDRSVWTGYAYWGKDKYFQQKAVAQLDSDFKPISSRISFTDYYADIDPVGSHGMTKATYSSAFHGVGNSGFEYTDTAAQWRRDIVPKTVLDSSANNPAAAKFDYDSVGRPVSVQKLQSVAASAPYTPSYITTQTQYYAEASPNFGAAQWVKEAVGTAVERTTSTLAYDSIGRATDVQDAKLQKFHTQYDADGVVQYVDQIIGSTSYPVVTYAYGTTGIYNGAVLSVTDELSGMKQSFDYQPLGQPGQGQVSQVHEEVTYAPEETRPIDLPDLMSYTVNYVYDPNGTRKAVNYETKKFGATPGTYTTDEQWWSYDDYVMVGSAAESRSRAFQTLCRMDATGSNRTPEEMQYSYLSGGQLARAVFAQSPQTSYTPTGGATYYTSANLAPTRANTYYGYDSGGRATGVTTTWQTLSGSTYGDSAALSSDTCTYETGYGTHAFARGLKLSSTTLTASQSYTYDDYRDFLTATDYSAGTDGSWTYDINGNRQDSGSTYNELNEQLTDASNSYTYDPLGNRVTKGSTTYTWDPLNRLNSIGTTGSYAYRADGMRVWKQNSSGQTLYRHDGQMGFQDYEWNSSTKSLTNYGLGARGIDWMEKTTGSTTWTGFPLYDAHGNMVATLARSGSSYALADQRSYDAWGGVRTGSSSGDPKGRYCASLGHKQDDESGFLYMRARYYDAGNGRFISEDRACSGLNWFSYGINNPVTNSDPSGQYTVSEWLMYTGSTFLMLAAAIYFGWGYKLKCDGAFIQHLADSRMYLWGGDPKEDDAWNFITDLMKASARGQDAEGTKMYRRGSGCAGGAVVALMMYSVFLQGMLIDMENDAGGLDAFSDLFGG